MHSNSMVPGGCGTVRGPRSLGAVLAAVRVANRTRTAAPHWAGSGLAREGPATVRMRRTGFIPAHTNIPGVASAVVPARNIGSGTDERQDGRGR